MSEGDRSARVTLKQVHAQAEHSSWWTNHLSVRLACAFVVVFVRIGVSPNTVTVLSAITSIGGAALVLWSGGARWAAAVFAIAAQVGYALDGADGILARVTGTGSMFGGWLDLTLDRAVHVAVLLLLAASFAPRGGVSADVLVYLVPHALLLALSLVYHNGVNLLSVLAPYSARGSTPRGAVFGGTLRGLVKAACDFGFMLFVLSIGMLTGRLELSVWGLIVTYAIGIIALGLHVRSVSRLGQRP